MIVDKFRAKRYKRITRTFFDELREYTWERTRLRRFVETLEIQRISAQKKIKIEVFGTLKEELELAQLRANRFEEYQKRTRRAKISKIWKLTVRQCYFERIKKSK